MSLHKPEQAANCVKKKKKNLKYKYISSNCIFSWQPLGAKLNLLQFKFELFAIAANDDVGGVILWIKFIAQLN